MLVLVILGLIWAAVLLPPYLQNRREHRPGDSIASFRHQLAVIERATPEGRARNVTRLDAARFDSPRYAPNSSRYAAPGVRRLPTNRGPVAPATARKAEVRRRRRDVFLTLLGAVGVTFLLAIVMGGPVWMLNLVLDVALLGYVGLLVKFQQEAAEKELKVRFLEPATLRTVEQPRLRSVGS